MIPRYKISAALLGGLLAWSSTGEAEGKCNLSATDDCLELLNSARYEEILQGLTGVEPTLTTNSETSMSALFYVGAAHYYRFQAETRLTVRCGYARLATDYLTSFQRSFEAYRKTTEIVGANAKNLLAYSNLLNRQLDAEQRCLRPGFSQDELESLSQSETQRQVDAFFMNDNLMNTSFEPARTAVKAMLETSSTVLDLVRDHKLKLDAIEQELDKRPGTEGTTYRNLLEFAIGTSTQKVDALKTANANRTDELDKFGRIGAFSSIEKNIGQVKTRATSLANLKAPMDTFMDKLFLNNAALKIYKDEAKVKTEAITSESGRTFEQFKALKGHLVGNPNPNYGFFKRVCSSSKNVFYCQQ